MVAMVGAVSAQELSLGVKGGLNMSKFTGKDFKDPAMKLGFNVGIAADYEFAPNMAIQSGLFFTTKGTKLASSKVEQKIGDINISSSSSATSNAMYLQVPIHFAYKMDVSPETRIVFHAGPYVAYGIGGKTKGNVDVKISGNVPQSIKDAVDKYVKDLNNSIKDYNTFDAKTGLKPFDAGLGLGVGAEFGSFVVDLGWDMGLLNLSRAKDGSVKTQNGYLSLGYKF